MAMELQTRSVDQVIGDIEHVTVELPSKMRSQLFVFV